MQASIVLSLNHRKKKLINNENISDAPSNLHESGDREIGLGKGVLPSLQRQAREGSEPLSQVLEVPEIG